MKCAVCNLTEITPNKDGSVPDCLECSLISHEAAVIMPEELEEWWADALVWNDDLSIDEYPYDEGLDLEE